ncbi:MAG: acyltransferase [Sphingomicrobium sp.]
MQNPFDPGYYESDELRRLGFASVGENVRIAKNCTIPRLDTIELGDNVRIDAFTSIIAVSGYVKLGSHVHICVGCRIGARGGFKMEDFTALSHGAVILTASDDFSGRHMINCTIPEEYTDVKVAPVKICRQGGVAAGSIVLPGVTIGEGSLVGAQSLVRKSLDPWGIYFGIPAKRLKNRSRALLADEALLLAEEQERKAEGIGASAGADRWFG